MNSKSSVPQGTESSNLSLSANNYKASGIPVSLFYFSIFASGNKAGNKRAAALVLRVRLFNLIKDGGGNRIGVLSSQRLGYMGVDIGGYGNIGMAEE